ncbi:MAG: hypothetical protein AMXMBFR47_20490 [Planctomycetota bacterium]
MKTDPRTIEFSRDGQTFVFSYHEGQEAEVIAAFVELADDPASDFDWYDAAVLSFQMGRSVGQRTEALAAK